MGSGVPWKTIVTEHSLLLHPEVGPESVLWQEEPFISSVQKRWGVLRPLAHFRGTGLQRTQVLWSDESMDGRFNVTKMTDPGCYQLLHLCTPSRSFRSADQLLLSVPNTKRELRGDVPLQLSHQKCGVICTWDLPFLFKTHLFSLAFGTT